VKISAKVARIQIPITKKPRPTRQVEKYVAEDKPLPELKGKIEELRFKIPIVEGILRDLKKQTYREEQEKAKGKRKIFSRGLLLKIQKTEVWLETAYGILKKAEASVIRRTKVAEWVPAPEAPHRSISKVEDVAIEQMEREERQKRGYESYKELGELKSNISIDFGSLKWCAYQEVKDGKKFISPLRELLDIPDLQKHFRVDPLLRLAMDLKRAAERAAADAIRRRQFLEELGEELGLGRPVSEIEARRYLETGQL